ncbi:MAG TPA: NAD(P)-dependent oxidoreductase [Streptosporangiaceae bacterium]|nr:NAD(P)-dependent oxidoreductase [Streptosporangiaceae bacterium]
MTGPSPADAGQSGRPVAAVLDAMPPASREVISSIFGRDFDVVFAADDSAEAKRAAASQATAMLTMWGAVDAATISAAPAAQVIQKLGIGTEKIDTAAAAAQGVAVLKAAGINADAVAELAVLLILAVGRHLPKAMAAARSGKLEKELLRAESFQLMGKTVGLLGLGHIGQAVARRLAPFRVHLIYHDLRRADPRTEADCSLRYTTAEEILTTADVISLHLPSTQATRNLIDASALSRVKPGLILVNTARGGLVDEQALADAIIDGRVLGAGLDVTAEEPLPVTSPLHDLDRVVLTPHVGGAVANNFPRVIQRAYDNVQAMLAGGTVDDADIVVWPGQAVS